MLLTFVAILAYANAMPHVLVLDDRLFGATAVWQQESDLVRLFTENVWAAAGSVENLYRPLFLLSVSIDARLFGENYAAWHGVNVGLHVLVTLLVFALTRMLLERFHGQSNQSSLLALMGALVFAVHPVHTEVVNSIFNRSELLATLFILTGCVLLLKFIDANKFLAWASALLAYSVALFSRETAIVMPGIIAVLVWCWAEGPVRRRFVSCLPVLLMVLPMLLYLKAREYAIEGPLLDGTATPGRPSAQIVRPEHLFDSRRILAVAGVWLQGMKMMVWPYPLKLAHEPLSDAVRVVGLVFHLGLVFLSLGLASKRRFGLLIGLAIFYLGLLPSSRLFGSDEFPHLTERYLYLPSVGFCLLVGFVLRPLQVRTDWKLTVAPVLLTCILMLPVTWNRNALWADAVELMETDYRNGVQRGDFIRILTGVQLLDRRFEDVVEICDRYFGKKGMAVATYSHCGTAYGALGRDEKAVAAFEKATQSRHSSARAHANLANFYVKRGKREEAALHFNKAIEVEKDLAMKKYRQGNRLLGLYSSNPAQLRRAVQFYDEALEIQPRLALAKEGKRRAERRLAQLGAN